MKEFDIDVAKDRAAILVGVCRGRLSEGLDFKDRKARAVIIVGIPYPNATEPRILLKEYFLNRKIEIMGATYTSEDGKMIHNISGRDWYEQ